MKELFCLFCSVWVSLCLFSCSEADEPSTIEEPPVEETVIPLFFWDDARGDTAHYEAVKIGEYLWMNRNINHFAEAPVTRAQLDTVISRYRLNPANFQVSLEDFNKYYGQYYSVNYTYYHLRDGNHGYIYEGRERKLLLNPETNLPEWKLASKADFRQLFAMCGDATEPNVRATLSCKPYENPAAVPITYWISHTNTNRYGFNAMPTGARHHAPTAWSTCFGDNDCQTFMNQPGDFYITFMAVRWAASDGTVTVHDYVDTEGGYLWHLQGIRFCRRLTGEELGYKLYIKADNPAWNELARTYCSPEYSDYYAELYLMDKVRYSIIKADEIDIRKVDLDEDAPEGYVELRKGYIRGFYVQYILNIDQPTKNIAQIINMTGGLR
ncbi:MAG: hypothetical protein LBR34_03155 [Prevotella sp.]|jgi:uncharacterized protein (TIGR02145 family)|nr:hypothetical protein [Prevotella sp.]